MKHLYRILCVGVLLLVLAVNSVQAQFVVNYQDEKGAPATEQASSLKVEKSGLSYLINKYFDISKINYIARFVSSDTNDGTVKLPEESNMQVSDVTVIGDTEEVKVDENGNFQTTANNLVAVNKDGQMIYRTIVSLEEGEQMREANLNAKETAVSLLLPMFSNIFQGMPDGVMAQLKRLIAQLPETDALAVAIDKSIVKNKCLNMADVESEFGAAVKKVADVSGLGAMSAYSPRRAARAAATDAVIEVKSLTRASVTVDNTISILKPTVTVNGFKGVFDVLNKSRLSYSVVKTGRKMLDGRVVPVNTDSKECSILPPVRVSRFVDSNTTWDDIKAFVTGSNTSGTNDQKSMAADVSLDFSTNDDVVLIAGPKEDSFMRLYNVTRTNMSIVVSDIINILKHGGSEVQDQFYYDFVTYLDKLSFDYEHYLRDPENDATTYSYYQEYFNLIDGKGHWSTKQKLAELFRVTFPLLRDFIQKGGEIVANEQTRALLTQMNTDAAEKIFDNYDFYIAMIMAYGENTLGAIGLDENVSGYTVEGLTGIVQPTPTAQDVLDEMESIYNLHVYEGCKDDFFYKLQMLSGTHPTLDTQVPGTDRDWNRQNYENNYELARTFDVPYTMIGAINELLADLEMTPNATIEAEARALRAWYYMYLAQNFGCISLRDKGETLVTYCKKPFAKTDDEVWDFIIADLKKAAEELTWQPRDNQQGRCTKGMAMAYLAEAYLWKAYKTRQNGGDDKNIVRSAADVLKQIIDSGNYALAPSFSTLWDGDIQWPREAIWQFANEMNPNVSNEWSRNDWCFNAFYAAAPSTGGWGSEFLSWELYFLYEQGDKRRDASLCTLPVAALPNDYRSAYCYGKNPYTQQRTDPMGENTDYFYRIGESLPGIWTTKLWRLKRASWMYNVYSPVHFYFKRYAGVLLDYAECLFRLNGGDNQEAWRYIDMVRNRAFGNMEVGLDESNYINYFNALAALYQNDYSDPAQTLTGYPVPFNKQTVSVEDAKTYYTRMTEQGLSINLTGQSETLCKAFQGKAEAWQVAIGQERRKEFSSEWNLKADLQRLDFMPAHIECNYPKNVGSSNPGPGEWHTYRDWDFDANKLLLPIPARELMRNENSYQNKGY